MNSNESDWPAEIDEIVRLRLVMIENNIGTIVTKQDTQPQQGEL
jgi:hypothetical protein